MQPLQQSLVRIWGVLPIHDIACIGTPESCDEQVDDERSGGSSSDHVEDPVNGFSAAVIEHGLVPSVLLQIVYDS